MAFPVPPDFFRCPSLGRQEHANLMATATTVVKNMMHLQHLDGSIRWKLHSQDGGLHLYQGANPTAPPQTCTWMGVLEVLASVHDVASLFGLNDTQSFRESGKFAFKDMLDGIVLYTLDESVYSWTGIRWLASTGGVPGLVKPRDYCYIESQGFFKQSQNRGWFLALRSIPLPCCPDLEATLGLVRGEILDSGITVMELRDRPGFVRVTHLFQQVARGGVPEWVVRNGVKNRIKHVGQLDQALKRRLLSSTPFLSEAQLVPITARRNIELVELLLNAHANIDATDNDGSTPIQIAAYHGQIAIVEKLLSSGADTNARRPDVDLRSIVVREGHFQLVKRLEPSWTLRHVEIAAANGHFDFVNYLIAIVGSNISALDLAVERGFRDIVRLVIHSFETDQRQAILDRGLLKAAEAGQRQVFADLLEEGANVKSTDDTGNTVVHYAARNNHQEVLFYVLDKLNDSQIVNCKNKEGKRPVHFAAQEGHEDMLACLHAQGAHLDIRLSTGESPLHLATERGHLNTVIFLVEHGLNPFTPTEYLCGKNAIEIATLRGHDDLIAYFNTLHPNKQG
ncbi:hypothetical protein AeRB84_005532 [Aphanomyces euteiches]|nr:hypothetical protein AeRB84_005532 [Aphanomyces euteiches]